MTPIDEPYRPEPLSRARRQAPHQQRAVFWARITLSVVVALLIGVIALPNRYGHEARLEQDRAQAAVTALHDLRRVIEAYRIDHGAWPGWSGSDGGEHPDSACAEVFVQQLTEIPEPGVLGPYLPGDLPANPLNGLATVRVLGLEEPWPLTADDRTGWIYDPRSGLIRLNSQGRLEANDVRYFDR